MVDPLVIEISRTTGATDQLNNGMRCSQSFRCIRKYRVCCWAIGGDSSYLAKPNMKTSTGVTNIKSELIAQIVAKERCLLATASAAAAIASAGPNTPSVSANRLNECAS